MRKAIFAVAVAALTAMLVPGNFAAEKHYIITNDDNSNSNANTATVFEVLPSGELKQVRVLKTGGTGLDSSWHGASRNAADSSPKCLFVSDAGSSDIAAFAAPAFSKVGNYSNSQLIGNVFGITLAVSPDSKFLFAAYSASSNIALWNIGSDCSLALNGSPYADGDKLALIAVTSDGSELVVSLPDLNEMTSYAVSPSGTLTAQPPIDFFNVQGCVSFGPCDPAGIDITNDGKLVIAANPSFRSPYGIMTASLSASGLSTPGYHHYPTATTNPNFVRLSPAAADGHGFLYLGMAGGASPRPGSSRSSLTRHRCTWST